MTGPAPDPAAMAAMLLALAERRGRGRSFCPSEVARALAADWRPLMPQIRAEAARLQAQGRLYASQKGRPVAIGAARGPIRLSLPPEPGP